MKFLTKLGQVLLQVTQVITGFAPLAKVAFPGYADKVDVVSQDLAEVAQVIVNVEAVGQTLGLPGAQKLQAAAPLVAQILIRSSLVANHKIANPTLFQQGAQKIADGMADVLNSLEDKVDTINKT